MNPKLQALFQQAIQAFQDRDFEGGDLILKEVLQSDINNADDVFKLGIAYAKANRFMEASAVFCCLQLYKNDDVRIPYNLGLIYSLQGKHQLALAAYDLALKIQPNDVEVLINKGSTCNDIKDYVLALEILEKAIQIRSDIPEAWSNKGIALHHLNLYQDSIKAYDEAIKLNTSFYEAWSNKSAPLNKLKLYTEALNVCDKALSLNPDYVEAWYNKGNTLYELKRYDEAITHYDRAIKLKADYAEAWSNKGVIMYELKRYDEAITHYDKALSLKPDYAEAWSNKGNTLQEFKRYDEAIAHYDKALSLKPDYAEAWSNKGNALNHLKRHSESAWCYQKALNLDAKDFFYLGQAHHQMMLVCDWTDYDITINKIFRLVDEGRKGAEPFGFQGIATSEALLKKCAEIYSNDKFPFLKKSTEKLKYTHNKIRIGYLCGEFREQATSILMTRIWELHDKDKFEIFAFDSGWDDNSLYRQRITKAFDKVFDISRLSDLNAAKIIQQNEIDILINLNGFFGLARQGVFSYKPSPIQVNYLGFPGTIGANYMDYIIADKVVIPEQSKLHYLEKVVYLPNSYQANDDQRKISDQEYSRAQLGLPDNAFVYACFNNNYKITPPTFNSWIRILKNVQGSVLWLLQDNSWAVENLKKEVEKQGVSCDRLIFAERLPLPEHLARHYQADLFLDTLPYNAHTTASDALWAGLPVLTMMGQTFPGRVAASLLNAIGLPELITNTQEQYETLAIELARNPKKLEDIKVRLFHNRKTAPLFDSPLFAKNIEAAYIQMYERYRADLVPEHITITI
jgi:protein O-GlcNAc transferase